MPEVASFLHSVRVIESQKLHGCASNRRQRLDAAARNPKVICPEVAPRMEQRRHLPRFRVKRTQVAPFSLVAQYAGIGQVVGLGLAAVLSATM